jgi:hypothetical protein
VSTIYSALWDQSQFNQSTLPSLYIAYEMSWTIFLSWRVLKRQRKSQNAVSNGIEMVCEIASEDSDWSQSRSPHTQLE